MMICEEELKKFFARETLSFEKFNFQIFTGNEKEEILETFQQILIRFSLLSFLFFNVSFFARNIVLSSFFLLLVCACG